MNQPSEPLDRCDASCTCGVIETLATPCSCAAGCQCGADCHCGH